MLDDYNREYAVDLELKEREVFVNNDSTDFDYNNIVILDKRYKVKRNLEEIKFISTSAFNQLNIVVRDMKEMNSIISMVNGIEKDGSEAPLYYDYHFDIEGEFGDKISFASTLLSLVQ